jgi:phosphatidylinositol glycan class A protein
MQANSRLFTLGVVFGPILCIIMAVQHYFFWFLEWYDPKAGIDLVEDHWTKEQFELVSSFVIMS